jgi:hypothetical protein
MPSEMPTALAAARSAWADLFATARAHPVLAVLAAAACTATSAAAALLNSNDDFTSLAVLQIIGLAVVEAFLITPILIASHRFVILGEITRDYTDNWLTSRFWRFFLLSAALVAALFVPILFAHWRSVADDLSRVLVAAAVVFAIASLWLSLLFPAIAVDAPGTSIRNAAADLHGHVWRIFWAGVLAAFPLLAAALIVGLIQGAIIGEGSVLLVRLTSVPVEGVSAAGLYVLLVVIASRFYLLLANRLKRPG